MQENVRIAADKVFFTQIHFAGFSPALLSVNDKLRYSSSSSPLEKLYTRKRDFVNMAYALQSQLLILLIPKSPDFKPSDLVNGILLFSPRKPEITPLNFALRLSVLPEYDAFDIVLFKVIADSSKVSRYTLQNADSVLFDNIFFKPI